MENLIIMWGGLLASGIFSLLVVSATTFSCLFPIFSRTSRLSLLLMFPSELLLDDEEKAEEEVEEKVEEDVLEVLDALLELELVLVTLELTECLLSPLARPPPSPRPPTPSWMEHLDRATFISATPDLFRRLTFLSVW